jgi:hypothetical protein
MNLEKIIEEVYDRGPAQYPAYNAGARKDFAPIPTKDGYNYQHQRNFPDNLTSPPPDAAVAFPWPLQTIVDDLSDSFVYLMTGMSKIAQCIKNNPTLTPEQKSELIKLYGKSKKALSLIKDAGLKVGEITNMAGQQPSQNPVFNPPRDLPPNSTPVKGNTIQIKLP